MAYDESKAKARLDATAIWLATPDDCPEAGVNRMVADRLGRELPAMYRDLLRQPLPERLVTLAARLNRTP